MAALGTRLLVLRIDGVDHTAAVSKAVITAGESESDFTSFADAAAGGAQEYKLALTLTQDLASTSLWSLIWTSPGVDKPFEMWPNGRPVSGAASVSQPKVSGTISIREPDGDFLGGEADKSTSQRFVTEVEWPCTARPTLATS